jgi:hypothetical protein
VLIDAADDVAGDRFDLGDDVGSDLQAAVDERFLDRRRGGETLGELRLTRRRVAASEPAQQQTQQRAGGGSADECEDDHHGDT